MAKKGPRKMITLECSECKNKNYHTEKNTRNTTDRVELKKFCKHDRKVTIHKETK
ncbi:MAG: 50S ribosomal protein L33 [Patescibacteria group bacterium]|nr:50S ribosomal protein L33 [Patescibacteria group bacterium]